MNCIIEICKMIKTKIILILYCIVTAVGAFVIANPAESSYSFPIAGDRSIAECINGQRPKHWNAEMYITTTEFARKLGYDAEEHVVLTEDGYILTLHRIKGPHGAQPIFLQHGLFGNSFNFVMTGKNKALAFILVDKGYDVWLGNSRGSTYSMCHTHYTTSQYKFWNFSWHEMGVMDLPAEIEYVTRATKQNVIYVGHSMGTTMSYVMAIERPDTASKVKVLFSLAPVAYNYNLKSPSKFLAPIVRILEFLAKITGGELIVTPPKEVIKYLCSFTLIQKKICATIFFIFIGFDYQQFNYTLLPTFTYHVSPTSFKAFNHYLHERNSGRFMYYDYGRNGNLKMYNSVEAPDYNISKINIPVGLFWSTNDYFSSPYDVQRFYVQLPNKTLNYKIKNPNFNHLDFLFAIEAPKYVYSKLLSVMENFR